MILMTAYDQNCASIGQLTEPIMEEYARRHGLKFEVVRQFSASTHPCWEKLSLVLDGLNRGKKVLWLDADVLITNPDVTPWIFHLTGGLQCSQDWASTDAARDFQTGTAVIHPDAIPLYEEALKMKRWQNCKEWGQSALRELDRTGWQFKITVHNRRVYNPVPIETGLDNGRIAAEPWRKGDWLCHLTGLKPERKVELFHKYKEAA